MDIGSLTLASSIWFIELAMSYFSHGSLTKPTILRIRKMEKPTAADHDAISGRVAEVMMRHMRGKPSGCLCLAEEATLHPQRTRRLIGNPNGYAAPFICFNNVKCEMRSAKCEVRNGIAIATANANVDAIPSCTRLPPSLYLLPPLL